MFEKGPIQTSGLEMFSIYKDEQEVIDELQSLIEKIANESIEARQKFFVGFSGKEERTLEQ